jgi:protein phosphatase
MSGTCVTGVIGECADVEGAAALTCVGRRKGVNEDAVLLSRWHDESGAVLAVVVDGMGSYGGGDAAARIAVDAFAELLDTPLPASRFERHEALLGAFYKADARIREAGASHCPEMGATAVAAIIAPDEMMHLHAGDCRLYLVRDGAIIYRTRDHSAVQVLVDSGRIRPEEAHEHHMRNLVTSCLGGPNAIARLTVDPSMPTDEAGALGQADGPLVTLLDGDRIVLCSDGLWGELRDGELLALINRCESPNDSDLLARELVALARDAGAEDDISVIVANVSGRS